MVKQYTNLSWDDFVLPSTAIVRPVTADERRVIDTSGPINREYIVNVVTKTNIQVLPDSADPGSWPQLTVCLDSGSIFRAGVGFASHDLGRMFIFASYDKIHRLIRDLSLSGDHAADGAISRTVLQMLHVFKLNTKPFGSGTWHEMKQSMLSHFINTESYTGLRFRTFAPLIAKDLGWPCSSEADFLTLWEWLPDAPGFQLQLEPVKKMRWFSVNSRHHDEHQSYWVLKMVLQHHFATDPHAFDPQLALPVEDGNRAVLTPAQELSALRSEHGGLRLAERVLTFWNHSVIRIYYWCTCSSWTWYTFQLEWVKTPRQGLKFIIDMSQGLWRVEIGALYKNAFQTPSNLNDMSLDVSSPENEVQRQQQLTIVLVDYTTHIAWNRTCSFLVYEAPPYSYSGMLSSSGAKKAIAMGEVVEDAKVLMNLEAVASRAPVALELLGDTKDLFPSSVRRLLIVFRRDKFSFHSRQGRRILGTMLHILPDMKMVEDLHQHIRDLKRECRPLVTGRVSRMRAAIDSGVLEQRDMPHRKTTLAEFTARFKQKPGKHAWRFNARRHRLGQRWIGRTQ